MCRQRRRSPILGAPASLAWILLAGACSTRHSSGDATVGVVGPAGGLVEVRDGELAGTAFEADAGFLQQEAMVRIEPATASMFADFVAVGPAARIQPVDVTVAGTVTLVVDAMQPAVVANYPAADLVVLRVDAAGRFAVLPLDTFDLGAGRVSARVSSLGTFWVAVRPSVAPFALADFLPMAGDYFGFEGGRVFYRRDATSDPNLGGNSWVAYESALDPSLLLPAYPRAGFYVGTEPDGSLRLGGSYSTGNQILLAMWQLLTTEPLIVPADVLEGREFANASGLDTFAPFGSTTAVPHNGGVRVRIGERHALTVPAGTFGDVVRVSFEVENEGAPQYTLELELARGVGPVALGEFGRMYGLTYAMARGQVLP